MRKLNIYKKGMIVIFAILPLFIFSQKSKKSPEGIRLNFHHFVGEDSLVLDDSVYYNSLNQPFTITKFNYYIGQIHLVKTDGKKVVINTYFLISEDEEKASSKNIELEKIPSGEYSSIEFILGVDSVHNCSGAQSGALDPINAMFWTWNTGYIFMKLEGKSTSSSAVGNNLEYHIGGYKEPSNCIRNITLKFDKLLIIEKNTLTEINIKADVLEILKTPTKIDFSTIPTVNTLLNATIIADNYADIFQLINSKTVK